MVSRRNRPQVDFNLRTPGLAVRKATDVPFIPATRRTGVGQNAMDMGSALQRLGSALGSLDASMSAYDKKDEHAEKLRMERIATKRAKDDPQTRVAARMVDGRHVVTDGLKQITDFKETDAKAMHETMAAQIRTWETAGWTYTDPDTGNPQNITPEFIDKWTSVFLTKNIYDKYGDGKGKLGELREPQVKYAEAVADNLKRHAQSAFLKYQQKQLTEDSYYVAEKRGMESLAQAYKGGLRGQDLLDEWTESGRKDFSIMYGDEVRENEQRSEIVRRRLGDLLEKMKTPGDALIVGELLNGNLRNKDGSLGAKLGDAYKDVVPHLRKRAKDILHKQIENQARERIVLENKEMLAKDGAAPLEDRRIRLPDGEVKTFSAKEQEQAYVAQIKEIAKARSGSDKKPENKWVEHTYVLQDLAGTNFVDEEIKDRFSGASWGLAERNPEELERLTSLYRNLKFIDPTMVNKYIPNKGVRARLQALERLIEDYPNMSIEQQLDILHRGTDEDGDIKPWSALPGGTNTGRGQPSYEKVFNGLKNNLSDSINLRDDEWEELEMVMRLRMSDPTLRQFIDEDEDGTTSITEFKKALEKEANTMMKGLSKYKGVILRPPPNVHPDQYKVMVQTYAKQLAKQAGLKWEEIRVDPLPLDAGIRFLDKNGNAIRLDFGDGQPRQAAIPNRQIVGYYFDQSDGKQKGEAIRSGGSALLRRSIREQAKQIEETRKKIGEAESTWTRFWKHFGWDD